MDQCCSEIVKHAKMCHYLFGVCYETSIAFFMNTGLFPPDKDQIWTDELNWLPIPIHSKPWDIDYTLQPDPIPCPRYDRALQNAFNSPEMKAKLNQISEATMARVLENAGYDKGSMMEIFNIWSNSWVEQMENKTFVDILKMQINCSL